MKIFNQGNGNPYPMIHVHTPKNVILLKFFRKHILGFPFAFYEQYIVVSIKGMKYHQIRVVHTTSFGHCNVIAAKRNIIMLASGTTVPVYIPFSDSLSSFSWKTKYLHEQSKK